MPNQSNLAFHWQGRDDKEDGALGQRVHHVVTSTTSDALGQHTQDAIALLGFACDEGVARNKGRVGAASGPDAIRQALANLAWHESTPWLDLGNVTCTQGQLEAAQHECAQHIALALEHSKVITLGGGHEVAWASFQGLASFLQHHSDKTSPATTTQGGAQQQQRAPKIGIINFDAHFDLRTYDTQDTQPSSGTPFHQIARYCQAHQWPFQYACIGVSRASNTAALFQRADELGVLYIEDTELAPYSLKTPLEQLRQFIEQCDHLYLTIDLDVFPAATVPGVSAPAARGVSLDTLSPLLQLCLAQPEKLRLADIAEYNPRFDIDQQTARFAARLCWDIAKAMVNTPSQTKQPNKEFPQ